MNVCQRKCETGQNITTSNISSSNSNKLNITVRKFITLCRCYGCNIVLHFAKLSLLQRARFLVYSKKENETQLLSNIFCLFSIKPLIYIYIIEPRTSRLWNF